VIAFKEHPGLSIFRYLAGVALSLGMAALPRRILESAATRLLRATFFPTCAHVRFYKSGRSALAAVFAGVAERQRGGAVLVPDYLCNVVHRAAAACDLRLSAYRTDDRFHADLDDIETKLRSDGVAALVLASLFGCQNRSAEVIERIRAVDRELILIVDDCQNLLSQVPFEPDDRTVVVFSFNGKHVPGVMGGGVASSADPLGLRPPRRDMAAGLALESLVLLALFRQVRDALGRSALALCGRARSFDAPEPEFSDCRRRLYDTRVQRIARLSLARGILGLKALHGLETRRRRNFARLREALGRGDWGRLVPTENVEVSPLVAIEGLHPGLVGRLPLKGTYARDDDPTASLRPGLLVFRNDGFCPFELIAQPSPAP